MRGCGTFLMVLGAFLLIATALTLLGPTLDASGINMFAVVTSVPGALLTGAALLFIGALLRRRAVEKKQEKS